MMKERRVKMEGHVVIMGVRRGAYRVLVGKAHGKGSFAQPRSRQKYNILRQHFSNIFFFHRPHLASKNNHAHSHSCSCKYIVSG